MVGVATKNDMIKALLMRGYALKSGVLTKNGEEVRCCICNTPITKRNIGAIIPCRGQIKIICNNNECMLLTPIIVLEAKKEWWPRP